MCDDVLKKEVIKACEVYKNALVEAEEAVKKRNEAIKFAYVNGAGGHFVLAKWASVSTTTLEKIVKTTMVEVDGDVTKLGLDAKTKNVFLKKVSAEYDQVLLKVWESGVSWAEIGRWVGVKGTVISARARRLIKNSPPETPQQN